MISRIRLIITTLVGCHLFLAPALLTSQLLTASDPQTSPAPQSSSNQQASPQTKSAQPAATPEDEGRQVMEEVVQQQMQETSSANGAPRPPANVVLNRDEVLIRADEQEKDQDVY